MTYRTCNKIDHVLASIELAETSDAKTQPQATQTSDDRDGSTSPTLLGGQQAAC
ncbi:hypothetical protein [Mycobacterium lepromatosis]|uniref:hypothetical protein n=1 Tax=Mycobacterium lepromatosis TaxID=480418 RepID=UPI000AA91DF5|nr:hypothetical protein [Mycobacterium lepromatosis]